MRLTVVAPSAQIVFGCSSAGREICNNTKDNNADRDVVVTYRSIKQQSTDTKTPPNAITANITIIHEVSEAENAPLSSSSLRWLVAVIIFSKNWFIGSPY